MAAPVSTVYKIVGLMILLVVVAIIIWSMIYSVHEYRTAALLLTGVIAAKSPLIGGALAYLVRTFVWF